MKTRRDFLAEISTVTPRVCPYFTEITASAEEVFLLNVSLPPELTDDYLARGWRHNSWYFYRNNCRDCRRCIPIRVPVGSFKPSKSQRRVLKKNMTTEFKMFEPLDFAVNYIEQSLSLFNKFLKVRYDKSPQELGEYFTEFFISPTQTRISALFIGGELAGNGFLDLGETSLSTIYFSFDPRFSAFSPGTFSILKEIEWARENGLKYYYLGYYIREISSMKYKNAFRPSELMDFDTGLWHERECTQDNQDCNKIVSQSRHKS